MPTSTFFFLAVSRGEMPQAVRLSAKAHYPEVSGDPLQLCAKLIKARGGTAVGPLFAIAHRPHAPPVTANPACMPVAPHARTRIRARNTCILHVIFCMKMQEDYGNISL
jgi:hypothetical protein